MRWFVPTLSCGGHSWRGTWSELAAWDDDRELHNVLWVDFPWCRCDASDIRFSSVSLQSAGRHGDVPADSLMKGKSV